MPAGGGVCCTGALTASEGVTGAAAGIGAVVDTGIAAEAGDGCTGTAVGIVCGTVVFCRGVAAGLGSTAGAGAGVLDRMICTVRFASSVSVSRLAIAAACSGVTVSVIVSSIVFYLRKIDFIATPFTGVAVVFDAAAVGAGDGSFSPPGEGHMYHHLSEFPRQ